MHSTDGRNGTGLMVDSAGLGRDVRLAHWVDHKWSSRAGWMLVSDSPPNVAKVADSCDSLKCMPVKKKENLPMKSRGK